MSSVLYAKCPKLGPSAHVNSRDDYKDNADDYKDNADDYKDNAEEEISDIARSETLDEIEEAWEDCGTSGELCLHHLSLDQPALYFLFQQLRNQGGLAKIQKVELYACSFASESCAVLFVQFLQRLGSPLKELFIVDTFRRNNTFSQDERAISVLQGLHHVPALERLAIDLADLTGNEIGGILQNLLGQSPKLSTLRLNDVEMDDDMWKPFLQGLQNHPTGLVHLDLDGWYLDDLQFKMLVDTLISSRSAQTLQSINVSRSDITQDSFKTLTRLVPKLPFLQELVLQNCQYLWHEACASHADFQQFLHVLQKTSKLQELRLGPCLPKELAKRISQATTHLHALDI